MGVSRKRGGTRECRAQRGEGRLGSCWNSLGNTGGKRELRAGWRDGERGQLGGTLEVKSIPDGLAVVADAGEEGHGDSCIFGLGDGWRQNA